MFHARLLVRCADGLLTAYTSAPNSTPYICLLSGLQVKAVSVAEIQSATCMIFLATCMQMQFEDCSDVGQLKQTHARPL